jgi:YD repeat-containing protein
VGNVLGIEDHKVAGGAQVQAFTYDALDRLLSASASARTSQQGDYSESYTYDGIGNLTSKGGVAYDYDGSGHPHDQPHAVTGTGSGDSFTYDENDGPSTPLWASASAAHRAGITVRVAGGANRHPVGVEVEKAFDNAAAPWYTGFDKHSKVDE